MATIRVIEVRAAENGYVITAFEREANYNCDYAPLVYKSFVATTAEHTASVVQQLCEASEGLDKAERATFTSKAAP